MKNKKLLLGGLLLLGVGFAAVTTTLYINGTTNIKADPQGFEKNVVFKTVDVDATSKAAGTTVTKSEDGKTLTFTTHGLKSVGEEITISYNIENKSPYTAEIGKLTCTPTAATANTYLSVLPANTLETTTLAANATSETDTVVITMKQSYAGTTGASTKTFTYECSLPVTAKETN